MMRSIARVSRFSTGLPPRWVRRLGLSAVLALLPQLALTAEVDTAMAATVEVAEVADVAAQADEVEELEEVEGAVSAAAGAAADAADAVAETADAMAETMMDKAATAAEAADIQASAQDTATPPDAGTLVLNADTIRFPRESFETLITVSNFTGGELSAERSYKVMSRGNEKTIVLTETPASERGQALLMRGRDLWIFMPTVSQPVRLSLSQRLTGQVANGDLARANFAGDYNAELSGREVLGDEEAWVLDLAAAGRGVTYAKVRYWISVADERPLKAEFYAVSGRLLKTSRYENFRELAGRLRPTRLVIEDAVKEGDYSVLEYSTMEVKDLPERMFTQQYLKRL